MRGWDRMLDTPVKDALWALEWNRKKRSQHRVSRLICFRQCKSAALPLVRQSFIPPSFFVCRRLLSLVSFPKLRLSRLKMKEKRSNFSRVCTAGDATAMVPGTLVCLLCLASHFTDASKVVAKWQLMTSQKRECHASWSRVPR